MCGVGAKFRRGFSLAEVVVVLAIVAVLLRLSAGVLRPSTSGRALEAAQLAVAGSLESARISAALRQRPCRLLILADAPGNGAPDLRLRECLVAAPSPAEDGVWIALGRPTLLPPPIRFVPPSAPAMPPPATWGDAPRSSIAAPLPLRVRVDGSERFALHYVVEFSPRGTAVASTLLLSPARATAAEGAVLFLESSDLRGIRVSQYGFLTLLSDAGSF